MSGEVPTLEFQQRKSRWRNSAHSQTVPCADSTFHGAHCSRALSPECCSGDYSQAAILQPGGTHSGFLTSCLISAMAAGLLLLPDAAGTEGIQQVTPTSIFFLLHMDRVQEVLGVSLASGTRFSILQHPFPH